MYFLYARNATWQAFMILIRFLYILSTDEEHSGGAKSFEPTEVTRLLFAENKWSFRPKALRETKDNLMSARPRALGLDYLLIWLEPLDYGLVQGQQLSKN